MSRALWWPQGGSGIAYERSSPVVSGHSPTVRAPCTFHFRMKSVTSSLVTMREVLERLTGMQATARSQTHAIV